MAWLSQNWFWLLIAAVFIGMHFFGHGCHGGHGGHGDHGAEKSDERDDLRQPLDKGKEGSPSQQDHPHRSGKSC